MAVVILVVLIVNIISIYNNWPPENLIIEYGEFTIFIIIVLLFLQIFSIGGLIYIILWLDPYKQFYLFKKEHYEKIIPMVREKFGLSSNFREILSKSDQIFHYFVIETEDGILISKRDDNGNELESELITNYNYLDLNYEPKNLDA